MEVGVVHLKKWLYEVSHDNSEKIKYSDGMSTRQLQQVRCLLGPFWERSRRI